MNPLRRKPPARLGGFRKSPAVTIRWATPADARSVEILATLDEAPVPPSPLLLAFVGDELWVARSLDTGAAVCDPFRPSAEVATLVLERGRQLTVREADRPRSRVMPLRGRWPTAGAAFSRATRSDL